MPKGISLLRLDSVIEESIAEAFKNPAVLNAAAERWLHKVSRSQEELQVKRNEAESELRRCDNELQRVLRIFRKNWVTEDEVKHQLRAVKEEREYWEEEVWRLDEAARAPKELQERAEGAKAIIEQVKHRLDMMTDVEWSSLLRLIASRIVVDRHGNLEIELTLPIEPALPPEAFAVYKTNHQ